MEIRQAEQFCHFFRADDFPWYMYSLTLPLFHLEITESVLRHPCCLTWALKGVPPKWLAKPVEHIVGK